MPRAERRPDPLDRDAPTRQVARAGDDYDHGKVRDVIVSVARSLSHRTNLAFAVADQGLSSLTNLGVSVAVAAISSSETFGALGVVVALYLFEYGIVHGAIVEPFSVAASEHSRDLRSEAIGAATLVGLVLATCHLLAGLVSSGVLSAFLIAFAVVTPALVVQVAARGLLIASGRSRVAFESNLIWALVQLVLTMAAWQADSSIGIFLAWAGGAALSAVYCVWRLGTGLPLRAWRDWFQGRARLAASWAGDYVAQQGLAQVVVFSLGAVAGLGTVGAYRGAILLTGPATVVVEGLRQVILPGAARRARMGDGSLTRTIASVAVGFPVATFVLMAPFLFLPRELGDQLLGETWEGSREILPWIILMRVMSSVVAAFAIGMRATRERRMTLVLRVAGGVSTLVAATAAGAAWGAIGASVAFAVASSVQVPFWWLAFTRHVRIKGRTADDAPIGRVPASAS